MKPVALVTGGARGIGLGISTALAADGWNLAVCGTRPAGAVQDTIDELTATGAEILYVETDIGDLDAHERLIDAIRARFGRLDALVNNAGVAPRERKDILDASPESFDFVLGTNLRGPYFLTRRAANWMIEQKQASSDFSGCIIFITSISSTVASVNRGEYCISKAGLSMAAALWAARLGEFGIPVYEIRPGVISTDMTAGVKQKYDALIESGLMVQKRWGVPEDIGKAAAMLLRGELAYSTGQVIMIDGGMTIPRL